MFGKNGDTSCWKRYPAIAEKPLGVLPHASPRVNDHGTYEHYCRPFQCRNPGCSYSMLGGMLYSICPPVLHGLPVLEPSALLLRVVIHSINKCVVGATRTRSLVNVDEKNDPWLPEVDKFGLVYIGPRGVSTPPIPSKTPTAPTPPYQPHQSVRRAHRGIGSRGSRSHPCAWRW